MMNVKSNPYSLSATTPISTVDQRDIEDSAMRVFLRPANHPRVVQHFMPRRNTHVARRPISASLDLIRSGKPLFPQPGAKT
jgi:hypothetical protein